VNAAVTEKTGTQKKKNNWIFFDRNEIQIIAEMNSDSLFFSLPLVSSCGLYLTTNSPKGDEFYTLPYQHSSPFSSLV
jgi:hypothetical protein